jgi:hypothetical protein
MAKGGVAVFSLLLLLSALSSALRLFRASNVQAELSQSSGALGAFAWSLFSLAIAVVLLRWAAPRAPDSCDRVWQGEDRDGRGQP